MIDSKEKLYEFLTADKRANCKITKRPKPFTDYEWRFLIALRKLEYAINTSNNSFFDKLIIAYRKIIWSQLSVKTGITVYPNCFGKGLTLWHYGYVVVNDTVKGGDYITLQCGVNISENVVLGDYTYLAPGAKVLKDVSIAKHVLIGANGVVTKNIDEESTTWVGVPVRKISDTGYYREL